MEYDDIEFIKKKNRAKKNTSNINYIIEMNTDHLRQVEAIIYIPLRSWAEVHMKEKTTKKLFKIKWNDFVCILTENYFAYLNNLSNNLMKKTF